MSLVALVCAMAASAATAELQPVEGRPYRYDTVETRGDGATSQRFAAHRTVLFRHDGNGWVADVTLDSIEQPDAGSVGSMFAAANAGLLHRTIRFHLDAGGAVTGIDDADAAWAALVDGMERMAATGKGGASDRVGGAQTMTSALRALPPERRQAMLASVLTPLLATSATTRQSGARAITLPARPPAPPGSNLAGTESVSRAADGTITIRVEASGAITPSSPALPGSAPEGAAAQANAMSVRNVDPRTGLLQDSHDTREVSTAGPGDIRKNVVETIITLTLLR